MILPNCPGSLGFKQPKPEEMHCPFCGGEMEIWTDEVKATCPSCNVTVVREGGASSTCLDWCKYAKMCVGEALYNKYLDNKKVAEGGHHDKRKGRKRAK